MFWHLDSYSEVEILRCPKFVFSNNFLVQLFLVFGSGELSRPFKREAPIHFPIEYSCKSDEERKPKKIDQRRMEREFLILTLRQNIML
jgi:hypothetical protein